MVRDITIVDQGPAEYSEGTLTAIMVVLDMEDSEKKILACKDQLHSIKTLNYTRL